MDNVSVKEAKGFVEHFLSGRLTPPKRAKTEVLSYHLPKTHGEHKCRSGRFERSSLG